MIEEISQRMWTNYTLQEMASLTYSIQKRIKLRPEKECISKKRKFSNRKFPDLFDVESLPAYEKDH